jgi:hypothetical protein
MDKEEVTAVSGRNHRLVSNRDGRYRQIGARLCLLGPRVMDEEVS